MVYVQWKCNGKRSDFYEGCMLNVIHHYWRLIIDLTFNVLLLWGLGIKETALIGLEIPSDTVLMEKMLVAGFMFELMPLALWLGTKSRVGV